MDVVIDALGWRVFKVMQQTPTRFEAHACYEAGRRFIRGVTPSFDYTAVGGSVDGARAAVLALAAKDRDWPLMLDTTMPGVHDWSLRKDGRMACKKCGVPQKPGEMREPCAA